uniref:Uncharacterized protein n=1 Tax=Eptatretus burgeri TaxID=7764 RepID=A0A8C4QYI6_EPTBU
MAIINYVTHQYTNATQNTPHKTSPGGGLQQRSVTEQQFMHDKRLVLKELGRQLLMHAMLGDVHTAVSQEARVSWVAHTGAQGKGTRHSGAPRPGKGLRRTQETDKVQPTASFSPTWQSPKAGRPSRRQSKAKSAANKRTQPWRRNYFEDPYFVESTPGGIDSACYPSVVD